MNWFEQAAAPDLAMASFIFGCLVLTLILFGFRCFDLSRFVTGEDERASRGSFFEYPDHALLLTIFGLVGLMAFAYIGWRVPIEITRIVSSTAPFELFGTTLSLDTLGRAAQVIGAVSFGIIALRLFKLSVFIGLLVLLAVLGVMAFGYVFAV